MAKTHVKHDRLSIDVYPEEHRRIKAYAVLNGMTIREYVLMCLHEHWKREKEKRELSALTGHLAQDPVLEELWENERDSGYDEI